MKTKAIALLLPAFVLLSASAPRALAESKAGTHTNADGTFVPKEKALSDYDKLRAKSPFEFDPPKVKTEEVINPFEGYSLAGYCGKGDTLMVTLLAGKEKKRIVVYGDGSPYKPRDESGFRVIGINRHQALRDTEVILEKDGQQGTVKFEEDTLRSKGPAQGQGGMIPGPNGQLVPRQGGGVPRPTGVPAPGGQNNYQAPAPFIPGQNVQPQMQPQLQPGMQNGAVTANPAIPTSAMNNDQLLNHVMNGTPAPVTNNALLRQNNNQGGNGGNGGNGGERPGGGRRKVVLPTTP